MRAGRQVSSRDPSRSGGANKPGCRWAASGASSSGAEVLGELQHKILSTAVLVLKLRRFTVRDVYSALKAMGYDVSRQSVCKALRRLVDRGIVVRVGRGYYELTDEAYRALERYVVFERPRYMTGPNRSGGSPTADGTSPPRDRGPSKQSCQDPPQTHQSDQGYELLEPGIYFDNVRGVRGGAYVHGDRGRFLRPIDLEVYDRIDYAEIRYATGTDWLKDMGVIVAYFSCGEVGFTGRRACSMVIEWRPPEGYYKRKTILDARREYREILLLLDAVALTATDQLMGLEGVVRAIRRWLRRGGAWARGLLGYLCKAYGVCSED